MPIRESVLRILREESKHNRRWRLFERNARSPNDFKRMTALLGAFGSLELALSASGVRSPHSKETRERAADGAQDWPDPDHVEAAARARHAAVHSLKMPDTHVCLAHLTVVFQAWLSLRNRFVTKQNAALLARQLLQHRSSKHVLLFGSLARDHEPRDVDLLVLDDGDLSAHWISYRAAQAQSVLEAFSIGSREVRAAERSGWLSTVFVNEELFGIHGGYTLHLMTSQPDPLFFLNLSDGLLGFDPESNAWSSQVPEVFTRLAELRTRLEAATVVRKQPRGNAHLKRFKAHEPSIRGAFSRRRPAATSAATRAGFRGRRG
jgi:predicted nucleotidyltransferase